MGIVSDRVHASPLWANLEAFRTACLPLIDSTDIEPDVAETLVRLVASVAFMESRVRAADIVQMSLYAPGRLADQVAIITAELLAFANDRVAARASAMNDACDTALAVVSHIPATSSARDDALSESLGAFRATLDQNVRSLREAITVELGRIERLAEKTGEVGTQLSEEKNRLTTLTSDFLAQFSAAQDARSAENTATAKAQADEFATSLKRYAIALSSHEQDLVEESKERGIAFDSVIADLTSTQQAKAEVILEKIRDAQADVEKLVGVIGNLGVTSGYLKAANLSRYLTWLWQGMTVLSLGGIVALGIYTFLAMIAPGAATPTWQAMASRAFVAVAIGLLAAYSASQAERSGTSERRNRRMALELEAIGPYLAPLNKEQQDAFRIQLGALAFGKDPDAATGRSEKDAATILGHLLKDKELRELIFAWLKPGK